MVRSAADRDRFAPPLDTAVADFGDAAPLAAALAGVERAYLVSNQVKRDGAGAEYHGSKRLEGDRQDRCAAPR